MKNMHLSFIKIHVYSFLVVRKLTEYKPESEFSILLMDSGTAGRIRFLFSCLLVVTALSDQKPHKIGDMEEVTSFRSNKYYRLFL
jgi:hypothetical protein